MFINNNICKASFAIANVDVIDEKIHINEK